MQKRFALKLVAAVTLAAAAFSPAMAQQTVKFANIVELSGAGASSGTQFNNGAQLAIKEINAAGGIPGPGAITFKSAIISYRCGNGVTEGIEECDDGNNANGDGCNEICEAE